MSSPTRRTVDRSGYREYIQSSGWAAVKERYRRSRMPQTCIVVVGKIDDVKVRCGATRVDLHHRTYKRLGNEKLMDLVPLCREHHEAVHKLQQNKPHWNLWGVTRKITHQSVAANGRTRLPQDT